MKYILILLLSLGLAGAALADDTADPKAGEEINWQVISSGGTDGVSTNYHLLGTIGQTAVGSGTSDNYGLSHGYWTQTPTSGPGCCNIRADINHDGGAEPDIVDLVYMVTFMFQEGPAPICDEVGVGGCEHYYAEADINGDGGCNPDISDLVMMVTYMFQEGPPPAPC